jgi:hypothetical protein
MDAPQVLLSVALGVALAAACGLRVFLPLLVLAIAGWTGAVPLAESFRWLATLPAILMLAVATLLEVGAYYVPGLDNLLDALATPVALLAGTVAAAAVMTDVPPLVRWTTAVIAGGGAAGLMQGATTLLRAKSSLLTFGVGNGAVATGELGGALALSLLALAAPVLAVLLVVVAGIVLVKLLRRAATARAARPVAPG